MSLFASSKVSQFMESSSEFQQQNAFETIIGNATTKQGVLNAIDEQIMTVLDDVKGNDLPIDVAFVRINVLIYYATVTINQLIPNASEDIFIDYYTFLFYFVINASILCTNPLLLPQSEAYKRCECNTLFRYLLDVFLPSIINKRCVNYKHNTRDTIRDTIVESLVNHRAVQFADVNIATLIADFTQFACDEFLVTMTGFCAHWQHDTSIAGKQSTDYWHFNRFGHGEFAFLIPKLLICSQNNINNNNTNSNMMFFANQMLIKSLSVFDPTTHAEIIRDLFANHVSIKPWRDANAFLDLLEFIEVVLNKDAAYVINLIATCMKDNHLLIFGNCKSYFDVHIDKRFAARELESLTQNIDLISSEFIAKYCVQNQQILKHIFSQILHYVTYIDFNDLLQSSGENGLMCKLRSISVFVLKHFEEVTFDQIPNSRIAFVRLKQQQTSPNHQTKGTLKDTNSNI